MDKFSYVKSIVTPKMLVQKYLGSPKRKEGNTWYYYSPLRAKERTPSLAVNEKKGITDFGTGKNYDIISFISELYNCNLSNACDIIANDFNIFITKDKNTTNILKQQLEEQLKVQEEINNWFNSTYEHLTNMYKFFSRLKLNLDFNSEILSYVYKKELYYDYWSEIFYNADVKQKLQLYKNRKRFDFYERTRRIL